MAGRNAAQLRADATATGYFNGPILEYVGDGYTVPWEVALAIDLPLGLTFWAYKQHLDALDLEASRLHDWLYTPYGQLINATRLEADDALFEELNAVSPIDARIVYAAVRFGGAPYFGTSQTGYKGINWPAVPPPDDPSATNGHNIGLAPAVTHNVLARPFPFTSGGGSMANIKCVVVFQVVTTPGGNWSPLGYAGRAHIGGWTESWISASSAVQPTLDALFGTSGPGMCGYRAALLPTGASIIGVRLYQAGAGKGVLYVRSFAGSNGTIGDPGASLLCNVGSATSPSVRRFRIGCIPDEQIQKGEFSGTYPFLSALDLYMESLAFFGWNGQQAVTSYPIFNISAGGLVTQIPNNIYNVGQIITISGALDANGKRQGGKFVVNATGPLLTQYTLTGWTFGACTGGTASQPQKGFAAVPGSTGIGPQVSRLVIRKVGRPFELYRGRRSRRRRVA